MDGFGPIEDCGRDLNHKTQISFTVNRFCGFQLIWNNHFYLKIQRIIWKNRRFFKNGQSNADYKASMRKPPPVDYRSWVKVNGQKERKWTSWNIPKWTDSIFKIVKTCPKFPKIGVILCYICNKSIFLVRENVLFGMFYINVLFPINSHLRIKLISLVNIIKGLNKILQNWLFHLFTEMMGKSVG